MSNLWILTEERPKTDVLKAIIGRFLNDRKVGFFANPLRIVPVLDNNQTFTFSYQVLGIDTPYLDNIYIKTVSGYSSFVDFLVYFQENEPKPNDVPIYAIEETKTDDSESRNTGVYQRCSKFVYIDYFYPNIKKLMLYSLRIQQKEKPTETNLFGSRLLATLGVEIIGKTLNDEQIKPFGSIDELIEQKNKMRKPPKGNVPILITKHSDKIEVSGRLFKSGGLSHDPNIGALSIIGVVLRKLGWKKQIVITMHGLEQSHLTPKNKFIQIANQLNIGLDKLVIPVAIKKDNYWKYDNSGEKLATIFIHLVVESFTKGYAIFENHAGCEKSYFQNAQGEHIVLEKYNDRALYKQGKKDEIIHIPDLILIDVERLQVLNIEGKTYQNRLNGIRELNNYDPIENKYIKPNYPNYKIVRTVVIYGSQNNEIAEIEIGFMLNENGKMILGIQAPPLFTQAIHNLLDYWKI